MQTILSVGSISNAMRGKRLLEKHGIRAYIRKTHADETQGCGYGLMVQGERSQAASILRNGGVSVLKSQGRDAP